MPTTRQVFIVDDSADYLLLVEQVFKRYLPHRLVQFFASSDAFYDYMQTQTERPRVLLMDLNMPPGRSGYEVLVALKNHPDWQCTPVVIMSNTATDPELKQCIDGGANSYIPKPMGLMPMKQLFESICDYWLDLNQLPAN